MSNSLKNQTSRNIFDGMQNAIYPNNPRKDGEYEVRSESDKVGKILLEERDRLGKADEGNRISGYTLRKNFLPDIPGHIPEKLSNLYGVQKYLDGMCKLAYDARKINHDPIKAVFFSTVNQISEAAENTIRLKDPLAMLKLPFRIFTAGASVISHGNKQEILLKQEFTRKSVEYASFSLAVMMAERRDFQIYRVSEMMRAYMSQNRQEWFSMGNALTGLHQMVNYKVFEMERMALNAQEQISGSTKREAANIGFRFVDKIFSAFK